jgi:sigma-54 dependent transcriptional regulator, acetoin dehydrogenase operon transcriptional activator AcoR
MSIFYQELGSLAHPWTKDLNVEKMRVCPQETRLSDLHWDTDSRDVALVNSKGDFVGWVPFSVLAGSYYKMWKTALTFYNTLLQTMDDAVTVVDQKGRVLSWNERAEELYQCSKKEIIGQPITDFFKAESLMLMSTIEQGSGIVRQYNQSQPDVHVLVSTLPVIVDNELVGGISVERNINDIVKLNDGLAHTTAYIQDLEQKIETMNASDPFYKIKGRSPELGSAIKLAKRVADTDASVLLVGESGVGKELFAQAIHKAGPRSEKPFIDLNCGAIPASLFESDLFGYEKGAFTGAAREGKKGKFDLAKGGSLFLDEIGELPLDLQVKLLRVLQERKFYRVGGHTPIPLDVRIISATNRNLETMISEGTFRQDLYYRLNVVSIEIPPLRDRIEDIPELIQLFVREFSNKYRRPIPILDPEVMYTFLHHPWHGNIRQLRNTIEHMIILADEEVIHPTHLPPGFLHQEQRQRVHSLTSYSLDSQAKSRPVPPRAKPNLVSTLAGQDERTSIQQTLQTTFGNKSAAAKLLGISRVTLYNKMKKYGLD